MRRAPCSRSREDHGPLQYPIKLTNLDLVIPVDGADPTNPPTSGYTDLASQTRPQPISRVISKTLPRTNLTPTRRKLSLCERSSIGEPNILFTICAADVEPTPHLCGLAGCDDLVWSKALSISRLRWCGRRDTWEGSLKGICHRCCPPNRIGPFQGLHGDPR